MLEKMSEMVSDIKNAQSTLRYHNYDLLILSDSYNCRSRSPNTGDKASSAHMNVSNRFKNKENKYGGTEEENLQEFLDEYFLAAEDHNLTAHHFKR